MATQKESSKINDLDKKVSLLQNDFKYISIDVGEVKQDVKGLRGDFKELTKVIASLGFVTQEEFEAEKKNILDKYVTKVTFEKLASKITPVLWFSGIAAGAVVTGIIGAIIAWVVNGGLKG